MRLYFSPMACSLASRITVYEAGAQAQFVPVDPKSKKLPDGTDYLDLNPMGMVPMLVDDDDWQLLENTAILPWIASRFPAARLLPDAPKACAKVQQWLGFINSELHKAVFVPLLSPSASESVKEYARALVPRRMAVLEAHLAHADHLVDTFTVADAYLVTVLNWAPHSGVDLAAWPAVQRYLGRMRERPAVQRALKEERALYMRE